MDNINYDFETKIDYILSETDIEKNKDLLCLQKNILSSKNFNNTFNYIESSLNILYEKVRTLQDIIQYSNIFLINEINTNITECKTILKEIEENRDIVKKNSYIKYNIPLINTVTSYVDRDGSNIDNSITSNNNIAINSKINKNIITASLEVLQAKENNCVYSSKDSINNNLSYRSLYMFKNIQGDYLEEKIVIKLNEESSINRILIDSANCFIKNIEIKDINGNIEYITVKNAELDIYFEEMRAIELTLTINAYNYVTSQENYLINKDNFSFLDDLNNLYTDRVLYPDKQTYYYYLFGIDDIKIQLVEEKDKGVFISKNIKIEELKENQNLTFSSVFNGNIEFSLIDGSNEIPLLPKEQEIITDEVIFYNTPTRFTVDITKEVIIKKDGNKTNLSLQEALKIDSPENIYTVSYTPIYTPITYINNSEIKIKAILRNLKDFNKDIIYKMQLKKNGGGKLWTENY